MNKQQVEQQKKVARVILIIAPSVAFAPLVLGMIGSSLTPGCNESNCYWGVLPWATFMTVPIGFVILIVGLILRLTARETKDPESK
jgi:disulfide bond formation protein DsbB